MTEKVLNAYINERFGTDLYAFVKNKVEEESLYDYEIANIVNVRSTRIGRLRSSYGFKRKNGFSRRFDKTYGPGSVDTFKTMIENRDISLSDIARHFEFSREYARQVYLKIYGFSYTEAHKRKQLARNGRNLQAG